MQSWSDHAELFRLLVENARDYAIFGLSPEGRILTWNPGAELLLGFSPQEAIGSDTSLIFTPEDKAQGVPEQELIKAAQAGRSVDERWHMRKNGSRFWASGMMFSLKNAEGKSQGFAKIIRDRTEEKRLLARLEEAVEARDEFLAVLAHELRNPLGSLQLNLDLSLIHI